MTLMRLQLSVIACLIGRPLMPCFLPRSKIKGAGGRQGLLLRHLLASTQLPSRPTIMAAL